MKKLLDSVISVLENGQPVVMTGVIASSGSTPRGAGAMMAVFNDGSSVGTIGGGAVEFEAQQQARKLFDSKDPHVSPYILTKYDIADLGMICGGDVTIYYDYIDPSDSRSIELFKHIRAALSKNENAWMIRRFENGDLSETAVYDESGLQYASLIREDDIKPLLGSAPALTSGTVGYYVEPLKHAGLVYVFGGGHVAQELVPLLARVGFTVVVYEDREQFARAELFPDASGTILNDFSGVSDRLTLHESDYAVIMTRGHQYDYEILEQLLKTPASYIGCIGSARKMATIKQKLLASGIPEESFDRLYSPIGLKIKADTPAEIAVSIVAEMILFRAQKNS